MKKIHLNLMVCLLCLLLSNEVLVAGINTTLDQQVQYEETKRKSLETQERMQAPHINLQEARDKMPEARDKMPEAIVLPKETVSFLVKDITIESEAARFKNLAYVVEPYKHHSMGAEGVNLVVRVLTDELMDRGYVTSKVIVPDQDLSGGVLRLQILPGYIKEIKFADNSKMGTWRNAFPTKAGDVLNIRELEQGLEQMKRVPNQNVEMQLVPGEEQGQTTVVLQVSRTKPWSIGVSFDDSGLESTGRLQAGVSAVLYNPTGLNDVLSYNYGKDAEHDDESYGSSNYSAAYSVPYGNYTFSFNKYHSEYKQTIADVVPFRYDGETEGMEFGVQRLLYRDRLRKTQATFKLIRKARHTYLDDEELGVQEQKTIAYQLGLIHRQYWGNTVMDINLYYQKGMPWWQAKPGFSDHLAEMATSRYGLWGVNFNLQTPVKLGKAQGRYRFSLRGQYTTDRLYGSEQFSIGGRYSVRGFDGEMSLAGENGFYIQNELSIPIPKISAEAYIGIDYGQVWGAAAETLVGNKLAGAVLGMRGSFSKNLQYEGFIGVPLYKPEGFKTGHTVLGFSTYMQI